MASLGLNELKQCWLVVKGVLWHSPESNSKRSVHELNSCVVRLHIWNYNHICQGAYLAPSHYLNQCWVIVNWSLRNKLQWNLNWNTKLFIHGNAFENVVSKMAAILSQLQCIKQGGCISFCPTHINSSAGRRSRTWRLGDWWRDPMRSMTFSANWEENV